MQAYHEGRTTVSYGLLSLLHSGLDEGALMTNKELSDAAEKWYVFFVDIEICPC